MQKTTSVASLAAVLIAGVLSASAGHGGLDGKVGKGLPPDLAKYDTNGDGVLSTEEKAALKAAMDAKRQAFLDKYDTNKDGVIDAAERAVAQTDRAAEIKAERTAEFVKIDADGNGKVTLPELQAAKPDVAAARVAALFARLDTNSDASVSLDEFLTKPAPAKPGTHGGTGSTDHPSRR